MSGSGRYDGKPLVRLLELYVLWAIGELAEADERRLVEMTPKLQSIYSANGSWHEVIASAVQFPADLQGTLRSLWLKNLEIAGDNKTALSPQQFAEMVVDENFPVDSTSSPS